MRWRACGGTGTSRLLVVDHEDHLVGIISLRDLLRFLSLKIELESDQGSPSSPGHASHASGI